MSILAMRFAMGILFLLLGIAIFSRRWLWPDLNATYDPLRMNLGAVLALVFSGLNLARWYAVWSYRKTSQLAVRYPLQPDPSAAPQGEPNPEFDFLKRADEEKFDREEKGE